MRDAYHHRLDVLVLQLARMCDLVGTAMRHATTALLDADLRLAEQVIADDLSITQARTRTEQDANVLLGLPAPLATDLRAVVATLRSAENIQRMGELANHIALTVQLRHPQPALPPALRPRFERMGDLAARMAATAGQIVRTPDSTVARAIGCADDEMDDLHRSLFTVISNAEWTHGATAAVDAALLSRYYERFADHAVSVSRRTALVTTGELTEEAEYASG